MLTTVCLEKLIDPVSFVVRTPFEDHLIVPESFDHEAPLQHNCHKHESSLERFHAEPGRMLREQLVV